uniref:4-oxalocrotonate tautomerase n=1 Tax=Parastrongyloides trichosuri TaxID=131310 RepID=A0A0N4Z353_PARTI
MPYVKVYTTLEVTDEIKDVFCSKLPSLLAEKLEKDVSKVVTLLQPNAIISSGGNLDTTTVWIEINNVGTLEPRMTQELSRDITQLVMEATHLPREDVSIMYFDMTPDMVARSGITVAEARAGLK